MNKKLIIIISIIAIVLISGIIGVATYTNNPEYVIKQYVKAINKGKFDKLKKYEYNYEKYSVKSDIDTYINKGISIESIQKSAYIESYSIFKNPNGIQDWTGDLYISLMNFNVENNYKNIKDIVVYQIYPGYNSLNQKYGGFNNIVVGKVHNRWKIVYSPYYYLE